MTKIHLFFITMISAGFLASAHNDSQWSMENNTDEFISIECRSLSLRGLPGIVVSTGIKNIAPRGIAHHDFSYMHNDGLGMNPGVFKCNASSPTSATTTSFSTTWGENVRLFITKPGQTLTISKSSSQR